MSSFLRRRAIALVAEAEQLLECGSQTGDADPTEPALRLLAAARALLRTCPEPPAELPAALRRLGQAAHRVGLEELSDRSYLEAARLESRLGR